MYNKPISAMFVDLCVYQKMISRNILVRVLLLLILMLKSMFRIQVQFTHREQAVKLQNLFCYIMRGWLMLGNKFQTLDPWFSHRYQVKFH